MQPRVTAVLIARRGGEPLQQTLDALTEQSRHPDHLVVVDAAGDDEVTAALASIAPTQFVTAGAALGFGELVDRAVAALPAPEQTSSPYGGVEEWLWLLRHDTTPDSRTLERLLAAVEIAPSVAAAGPKQMDADHPTMIAEFGETMTAYGAGIALAERELDQAQHDRTSDVLAVGEAGMLVRRSTWHDVEGFDPALPHVDASLDLGVRIRLAGHRIVVVPHARVFVHESTPLFARNGTPPSLPARVEARWRRRAQLHRRLVYAPLPAVPLHWLSLLPLALLRSILHLLRKRPTLVIGEFVAALAVAFSGTAVSSARSRLSRSRKVGWAAIEPLRMPRDEVRRRRAIAQDALLSAREDDRPPRPDFLPGGGLIVAVLALLGAIAASPLFGAPALLGGALAPLAPDLATLWGGLTATEDAAADPFAFVLALLGTLTPWQPSLSLVVLWIAAVPLAGLSAWWAAASLVRRAGPAAVAAWLWALSPTLLVSLAEGRVAAVVAHLALPSLVASAARAPRSWSAAAVAGLSAAIVTAAAPTLVPALLLAWVAWMVLHPRRIGRLLTLIVPAAALWTPLVIDQVLRGTPLGLLADPGLPSATGEQTRVGLLLGWPDLRLVLEPLTALLPAGTPPIVALLVVAALVTVLPVLALLGLALRRGRRGLVPLGLAAAGLLTALAVSGMALVTVGGTAVGLDVAPALGLYWLGLTLAAVVGLDGLRRGAAYPGLLAVLGGTAVVLPVLGALLLGTAAVAPSPDRTLPALVAAEAGDDPAQGTLVLTPVSGAGDAAQAGLAARIDRGAGLTLIEQRTMLTTRSLLGSGLPGTSGEGDLAAVVGSGGAEAATLAAIAEREQLAELVANLAAAGGRDVTETLDALGVRFVLLAPPSGITGDDAAVLAASSSAALDATAQLEPVGDTSVGRLWRVAAADSAADSAADDARAGFAPERPGAGAILVTQLGILTLTLLLAIPTSLRPRRPRSDSVLDEPAPTFEADDEFESEFGADPSGAPTGGRS
ncbi:glycosyltransferase [Microcella pacifica]|uniref:Glycosyltransferase family 2 protein n=1 Tax=Microcella pacifica TaxID=2591847 RepID=A0A9E5MK99_9MICO|nr:glycosyltransferase [Microcella pacifica]NHF62869.1 glycosyltransferase family 2 protein [Microcella pacifica]